MAGVRCQIPAGEDEQELYVGLTSRESSELELEIRQLSLMR
jgi:hypothetical protein